jgi:hypothetical protein
MLCTTLNVTNLPVAETAVVDAIDVVAAAAAAGAWSAITIHKVCVIKHMLF